MKSDTEYTAPVTTAEAIAAGSIVCASPDGANDQYNETDYNWN